MRGASGAATGPPYRSQIAEDIDGAPVFLARTEWEANYVVEKNPELKFAKTRERG